MMRVCGKIIVCCLGIATVLLLLLGVHTENIHFILYNKSPNSQQYNNSKTTNTVSSTLYLNAPVSLTHFLNKQQQQQQQENGILLSRSGPLSNEDLKKENSKDNSTDYDDYYNDSYTPYNFVEVKKSVTKKVQVKNNKRKSKKKGRMNYDHSMLPVDKNPFSPVALRERAKGFDSSSSMCQFLQEQERRHVVMERVCSRETAKLKNKTSSGDYRSPTIGLTNHNIIIDRADRLTFCPIYKAASTSWSIMLLQLRHKWKQRGKRKLQKQLRAVFPTVSVLAGMTITRGTTKFMVFRHPFERLLSCYRDKYEEASKNYYYTIYGERMIKLFRKRPSKVTDEEALQMQKEVRKLILAKQPIDIPDNFYAHPVGPTFVEFAQWVIKVQHDDEHWKSYAIHCSPCHVQYDFVLRFEDLSEEGPLFIEYINKSSEVEMRWDNSNGDKHKIKGKTSVHACNYFNQLNLDIIKKLYKKYYVDFDMFQYNPEEYYKCAKDYINKSEISSVSNQEDTST